MPTKKNQQSDEVTVIKLQPLHANQLKVKGERKRRNVLVAGRRFGKNILMQDLAIEAGAYNRGFVGWGAPVYKQTLDDFRALDSKLGQIVTRRSISEMRLEIEGGGVIEFWSLDKPDSIRGKKYNMFIVNEAGFVSNLMDIRNYIIMPTLLDYSGVEWYAGTPKGHNGFFTLYNQTGDDWARWQMSSYSNPHVPASELDALKSLMPERAFAQEILAQFLEDGGGVFRGVRAASTLEPMERGEAGRQYVIGVDWGRSNDATVFSVLDVAAKRQVYLDRMTDTDYASQRARLVALVERFNRAHVIAEANSIGTPNIEALQAQGLSITPFTTTNATKAGIIQMLELALERGQVALLNDETQMNELIAYQSEKLPSGLVRYNAPEGLHDDCVISLCLALYGCEHGKSVLVENPFDL